MARTTKRILRPGVDSDIVPKWFSIHTAGLYTIGPEHYYWRNESLSIEHHVLGNFVRIQPPADATDARIETLQKNLRTIGVKGMKLLPRAAGQRVVGEAARVQAQELKHLTPRSVVRELVDSSWYEDKLALGEVVEEFLSKAEDKSVKPEHTAIRVGHITGVRLENWLCYRGQQQFDLKPTAYAVVAEEEGNPERSNWLGKTSLLDAIFFVVTGEFPVDTADEWIHENEIMGGVDIEFSSGLFISRHRSKGKATHLEVQFQDVELHGDAAQRFIDQAVITTEVFVQLFYIRQDETAKFVRMKPTATSDMVSKWLGIEWLQDATAAAMKELDSASSAEVELTKRLEEELSDTVELEAELVTLKAKDDAFKLQLAQKKADEKKQKEWNEKSFVADKLSRYEGQVQTLKAIVAKGAPDVKAASDVYATKAEEMAAAKSEHTRKSAHCGKPFDGDCPAFTHLKLKCPHTDHINANTEATNKEAKRLEIIHEEKRKDFVSAESELETLRNKESEFKDSKRLLDVATANVVEAKEAQQWLKDNKSPTIQAVDVEAAMQTTSRIATVQAELKRTKDAEKQRTELQRKCDESRDRALLLRAAVAVLGRNGAQRVIADRALRSIEQSGNEILQRAGVPLSFHVSWKEETAQAASECDKCGHPYPSSVKVKQCQRCNEPRGRKYSEKLRIKLTDRSGGADAIAGFFFKLAAAHWYRSYRELGWPIFLIDEPFGALDKANVKALSVYVSKLLQFFDAEQAFVVDHHTDVLDSMPSRIKLVSVARRHTKVVEVVGG